MQAILADRNRKVDYTLDIYFPDATSFSFATAPLDFVTGRIASYTNDLETVGDINRTIESPVNSVSVGIQNKDRVLGLHVATYWQKWRTAEAVIGRYYRGGADFALAEWIERFRGAIQKPNANDLQVTMDIVPDTVSPGLIVATRGLGLLCPSKYKHPKTCGSTTARLNCNHVLKSSAGCDGDDNSHRFAGMEHRNNPDVNVPGSGGNPVDPPGPINPPCPRLDQYVKVRGDDGKPVAKMVCFFTEEDWLWNPIRRRFYPTRSATVVKDEPIFELVTNAGAVGYSSFSHPVLWHRSHETGEPVSKFAAGNPVLGVIRNRLQNLSAVLAQPTGEKGDVMRIEMDAPTDAEKIYCYGDAEDKMIACHNYKPWEVYLLN